MKVSVLMLVYEHGEYVEQAINSVLNQKASFDFELIAVDDASTDTSAQICRRLSQAHPETFRFIEHSENNGMHASFQELWNQASGDYVAFCEGDDYWVRDDKLAIQVELLDENPSWNLVGAKADIIQKKGERWESVGQIEPPTAKKEYSFSDLIAHYHFHFSTVVLRKHQVTFPEWFQDVYCVDRPLYLLATEGGRAGAVQEVVSHYRLHDLGNWSTLSARQKTARSKKLFNYFLEHFDQEYSVQFKLTLFKIICSYVGKELTDGKYESAHRMLLEAIRELPWLYRLKMLPRYYRVFLSTWFKS